MEEQPLTSLQRIELISDLQALEVALKKQLQANEEGTRPVGLDAPIGRLSRMDAIQQQKMAQAASRNLKIKYELVRTAQISSETADAYGICKRCEEPIGYNRLKAKPETPFCIRCQREVK